MEEEGYTTGVSPSMMLGLVKGSWRRFIWHVYEVVMVPCGQLYQTEEPLERAVGVVLWWEGRWEGVLVSVRV